MRKLRWFHCSDVDTIGNKRPSPDYDEDEYENDPFGHKKVIDNQFFMLVLSDVRDFIFWKSKTAICAVCVQAKSKAEEAASGVTTGMILSLRERYF